MLKLVNDEKVSYILTEQERFLLASEKSKELIKERLANLDNFIDKRIDFFTGKEISKDDIGFFNVEKDGVMQLCPYDIEHEPENEIQKEAKYLLMWRYGNSSFYYEVIGKYIYGDEVVSVDKTTYNDCEIYMNRYEHGHESIPYEKVELNENNRDEIKKILLSE